MCCTRESHIRYYTINGRFDLSQACSKDIIEHLTDCDGFDWEPPPKPTPKYRPFANAEEFKPFCDKWLRHRDTDVIGRVCNYSDKGIVTLDCGFFKLHSFEKCLTVLTFEDGTPFGILEQP
jgi:hypothetical protein